MVHETEGYKCSVNLTQNAAHLQFYRCWLADIFSAESFTSFYFVMMFYNVHLKSFNFITRNKHHRAKREVWRHVILIMISHGVLIYTKWSLAFQCDSFWQYKIKCFFLFLFRRDYYRTFDKNFYYFNRIELNKQNWLAVKTVLFCYFLWEWKCFYFLLLQKKTC